MIMPVLIVMNFVKLAMARMKKIVCTVKIFLNIGNNF